MEYPQSLYTGPMDINNGGGLPEGIGGAGWRGTKGEKIRSPVVA